MFDYISNSIDWLYSTIEYNTIYKVKIWFFFDYLSEKNFILFWFYSQVNSNYQVYYALFLDKLIYINNSHNPFINNWLNNVLSSNNNVFIWIYHPELIWNFESISNYYNFLYTTNEQPYIYNNIINESSILSFTLFIHLIFLIFFISIFLILFFSIYSNQNNDENIIDFDYLNINILVESEKEITSIDDILILIIPIIYIFGFYFSVNSIFINITNSSFLMIYSSLFILFIFILGMPTLLLLDLGIYFLLYLKGVGKSSICFSEVVYDYIACVVFYTRIFAQWIRLILMFVTYLSLSHYIIEFELSNNNIVLNENSINNLNYFNSKLTYYIIVILPAKFIYWSYEILHTFFLTTSQFVAFFAIVFWLILFLYTFFVVEQFELFFIKWRGYKANNNKRLLNVKYKL